MGAPPLSKKFSVRVVGVTFVPTYPRNLYALDDMYKNNGDGAPLAVVLVRNPANQHDSNAIEVHVPALGQYAMLGHLPAAIAKRMAPSLDTGEQWSASVEAVQVNPEHMDRPGISIECARVDEPAETSTDEWSLI